MRRLVVAMPLLALIRQQSLTGLIGSLGVLPVLNVLVLGGLYQSLGGQGMDLLRFSAHWPYFVAVAAFVSGAASWEIELLSAMRGAIAGRPVMALWSRTGHVLVASSSVVLLFLALRAWLTPDQFATDAVVMATQVVGFATLGSGVTLLWGFGSDKGVNNLVQVAPWVFALGPGPFLPAGLPVLGMLFPASGSDLNPWVEIGRSGMILAVGLWLTHRALGPCRRPTFNS